MTGSRLTDLNEVLPDVLWVGEFPFPTGSAGSNILQGHCAALKAAGYSVGMLPSHELQKRLCVHDEEGSWRNVKWWNVARSTHGLSISRFGPRGLLGQDPRLEWLAAHCLRGVKAIILYPGVISLAFLLRLKRICKSHGVRLFVYIVEWHKLTHYRGRWAALQAMDSALLRRWGVRFTDGIICISKRLDAHFKSRGHRTALIPPLLDLEDPKWCVDTVGPSVPPRAGLRILFSGSPKRERHDLVLDAVRLLREEGIDVSLEFLGSTRKQILECPRVKKGLLETLGTAVKFHGFVSSEAVREITSAADYGILLRHDESWSASCFPSKVPELFALRVPVIANLTSDLRDYLTDGINSIIVKSVSLADAVLAFRKAATLGAHERSNMRCLARQCASRFDGTRFGGTYAELLSG